MPRRGEWIAEEKITVRCPRLRVWREQSEGWEEESKGWQSADAVMGKEG